MKPYMFVIKSVPLPSNQHSKTIRHALVHIWVFSDNINNAQTKACDYIKSFKWNPLSVEHAFEITEEQLSHLHKDEDLLYRKACQFGIAADFLASPMRDKSPDAPIDYLEP